MKHKVIALSTFIMAGLVLVFAMLDINKSTVISGMVSQYIYLLLNWLGEVEHTVSEIDFLVRKLGHFGFYALLSSMMAIVIFKKLGKLYRAVILSSVVTLMLSITDEYIQNNAMGRNSSYFDIVIDMAGAAVGLLIFSVTIWVIERKNGDPSKEQI